MLRWVLNAFALLLAMPASAQLLDRSVGITVTFPPPGGSTDLIARVVAEAAGPSAQAIHRRKRCQRRSGSGKSSYSVRECSTQ